MRKMTRVTPPFVAKIATDDEMDHSISDIGAPREVEQLREIVENQQGVIQELRTEVARIAAATAQNTTSTSDIRQALQETQEAVARGQSENQAATANILAAIANLRAS